VLTDFTKDFSELHLYVLVARAKDLKAVETMTTYNDIALTLGSLTKKERIARSQVRFSFLNKYREKDR